MCSSAAQVQRSTWYCVQHAGCAQLVTACHAWVSAQLMAQQHPTALPHCCRCIAFLLFCVAGGVIALIVVKIINPNKQQIQVRTQRLGAHFMLQQVAGAVPGVPARLAAGCRPEVATRNDLLALFADDCTCHDHHLHHDHHQPELVLFLYQLVVCCALQDALPDVSNVTTAVTNTVASGATSAFNSAYNSVSGRKMMAEFVARAMQQGA